MKKPRTIEEQLTLLERRGLTIDNRRRATEYLARISYFRLKFYWWDMQEDVQKHVFVKGHTFSEVVSRYEFDKELRCIMLMGIETIEIALRAKIIYHMSQDFGPLWYLDPTLFCSPEQHQQQFQRLETEFQKSGESFAKDFLRKNTGTAARPEAWLILEVATFGELSKIYKNIAHQLPAKSRIANDFGLSIHSDLSSWLEAVTYLRNIVAHHSRLWGRNMVKKPATPRNPRFPWLQTPLSKDSEKRPFHIISAMLYLCSAVNSADQMLPTLHRLFLKYPNVNLAAMGFPAGWESEGIWM